MTWRAESPVLNACSCLVDIKMELLSYFGHLKETSIGPILTLSDRETMQNEIVTWLEATLSSPSSPFWLMLSINSLNVLDEAQSSTQPGGYQSPCAALVHPP